MDAFATKEQMAEKSQGAIPASTPFLEDELAAATGLIRDYCRWHIAKVRTELKRRHRTRLRETVWLPATRIVSIDNIVADGKTVDPAGIDFDPETGWTDLNGSAVTVEYTAGYAEVPPSVVSLTLHIAARALGSPLGLIRETAGGVSIAHTQVGTNAAGGTVLLPHEMTQLDAFRIGWIA